MSSSSPRHKKDQRGGHEHNYREQDNSRFADADIKVWAKDEDQMSQISQAKGLFFISLSHDAMENLSSYLSIYQH